MRAGVYGRESQGNEGSRDDQTMTCCKGCESRGWTVVGLYGDLTSASRFRRKVRGGWDKLVADVTAGRLDVVSVWEPSRGDRDLETWVPFVATCRRLGVLIRAESHNRTYDPRNLRDWRSLVEDGLDAAYESEKTSVRVLRGMASQATAGRPHGRTTYGHERVYDPVTGKFDHQRPHPVHGPIVASILEDLAKGVPLNAIVRQLTADQVPPPEGAMWRTSTIRAMATNPVHIAQRSRYGELTPAQWEPLVSMDTWERIQRILGDPSRKRSAPGAAKYLLSYIGTSPCGRHLVGDATRPGRHARYSCGLDGCVSIAMAEADDVVSALIVARLARKDARWLLAGDDTAERKARAELARLELRLEEFRTSADDPDGISATALARQERILSPKIEAARVAARAAAEVAGLADLIAAGEEGGERRAREVWDDQVLPVQRGVIKAVATVRLVHGSRPSHRWMSQDDRKALAWERVLVEPA